MLRTFVIQTPRFQSPRPRIKYRSVAVARERLIAHASSTEEPLSTLSRFTIACWFKILQKPNDLI